MLRERLFGARGAELLDLCKNHRQEILANFPSWQKVPEEIRQDPQRLKRHVESVIAVAQCFLQLGDPSLMARLQGGKNPLAEWQEGLQQVRRLLDEGRFDEAIAPLEAMLAEAAKLRGTGVDQLLPFTLEYLGEAHFHRGQAERAVEPFERALALVQDDQGRRACQASLAEVRRYLGGDGAPLLRVVLQSGERRFEVAEAPPLEGRVQILFQRNRPSLRGAELRTTEGEELASKGLYNEALACFEAAAAVDLYEPHCRYLAALTLLHLRRYAEASSRYREVEQLAPGWFHSRHDAWLAAQLECGKLPHEAFEAHLLLEDGRLPALQRLALADEAARWPLPSAQLHRGRALKELGRLDEATQAFRRGLELAGDADLRARLSLELGVLTKDDTLIRAAADPNGNLVAAAQAQSLMRMR